MPNDSGSGFNKGARARVDLETVAREPDESDVVQLDASGVGVEPVDDLAASETEGSQPGRGAGSGEVEKIGVEGASEDEGEGGLVVVPSSSGQRVDLVGDVGKVLLELVHPLPLDVGLGPRHLERLVLW